MLKRRIVTASCLLMIFGYLILLAAPAVFATIINLITCLAAWEWLSLLKFRKLVNAILLLPFAALAVGTILNYKMYWILYENLFFMLQSLGSFWVITFVLIVLYSLNPEKFQDFSDKHFKLWQLFGYIACCLVLLPSGVAISYLQANAKGYLIDMLLVIIGVDLGGYIWGKLLGKHKLSKISPGKTWEGIIGGYFTSLLLLLISSLALLPFFKIEELLLKTVDLKFLPIYILLPCSLAVLGDLFASLLKRIARVKDSGKLLPGHGGILDRIDGLSMAMPVILLYYLILASLSKY